MSATTRRQLPKFARQLERKFPGLKVSAYVQAAGASDRQTRTINFTGPLEKLIEYGLAQKFGGRGRGNDLRYIGDGVTEGVGAFYASESYIFHHLVLDPDADRDVTKRAERAARQILRRIQRNARAGAKPQ